MRFAAAAAVAAAIATATCGAAAAPDVRSQQVHADFVGMTFGANGGRRKAGESGKAVGGVRGVDTATFSLVMLNGSAANSGAMCLDGTDIGFYWQAGTGLGAYNWMFYFQGGGWVRCL